IAYDASNGMVYLAEFGNQTVGVLDPGAQTFVAQVALGGYYPYGVAVDPAKGNVLVGTQAGGNVTVINASTNTVGPGCAPSYAIEAGGGAGEPPNNPRP